MKRSVILIISCLIVLSSCEKEDFNDIFEGPSKLITKIQIDDHQVIQIIRFKYDDLNRLIDVEQDLGESVYLSVQYFYDSDDQLIKKVSGQFTSDYVYHKGGNLKEQVIHFESKSDGHKWEQKTEFHYSRGRIKKAIEYTQEGEKLNEISYKYDLNGNTIHKIVRWIDAESDDFLVSESKFEYDNKVNPCRFSGIAIGNINSEIDIVQSNNPTYSYYYNSLMSMFPPEFEITYEYDLDRLPVKAIMNNLRFPEQEPVIVVYEYQDKL